MHERKEERRRNKKKEEETRRNNKKNKKKKNKIGIFSFDFLDCEEKQWNSGAIFHIRIAKGFRL